MWGRARRFLFENLGLKIASLLLALLIYAHVVTEQEHESLLEIPVTRVGLPDSLVATGSMPLKIGVKVRGKWKDLIRLELTRPYLSVDLAGTSPGAFRASITAEDVRSRALPPELSQLLTITEVLDPRTVDLVLAPRASKRVLVAVRVVGNPPRGYQLRGPARVDPDTVRVEGTAESLAALDTVYTVAVDITGEREKIQRQVELDLASHPVTADPRRCLVTLWVARAAVEGPPSAR